MGDFHHLKIYSLRICFYCRNLRENDLASEFFSYNIGLFLMVSPFDIIRLMIGVGGDVAGIGVGEALSTL